MVEKENYQCCFGRMHVTTGAVFVGFIQFLNLVYNYHFGVFFQQPDPSPPIYVSLIITAFLSIFLLFHALPLFAILKKSPNMMSYYRFYTGGNFLLYSAKSFASAIGLFLNVDQMNGIIAFNTFVFSKPTFAKEEASDWLVYFAWTNAFYFLITAWCFMVLGRCEEYLKEENSKNNENAKMQLA